MKFKKAKRYRCQPARCTITPAETPGRARANFLFHHMSEEVPAVDWPVVVEIYDKDADQVKKQPELIVVERKGRPVAVKAGGRYTPSWYELNSLERIKYRIAMIDLGFW